MPYGQQYHDANLTSGYHSRYFPLHLPSPTASHWSRFTKHDVNGAVQLGLIDCDIREIIGESCRGSVVGSPTVQKLSQGHAVRFFDIRISSSSTSSSSFKRLRCLDICACVNTDAPEEAMVRNVRSIFRRETKSPSSAPSSLSNVSSELSELNPRNRLI